VSAVGSADTPDCTSPERLLLPWVVTGRLAQEDAARVDLHLRHCASCRQALEQERALAGAIAVEDTVAYAPAASLNAFMARLDAEPPVARTRTRGRLRERRLLLGAVAVQALVIAGLAALLFTRSTPAEYTTLSRPVQADDGARLHVVFAPAATAPKIAALLTGAGVRVVDGPGESGVYTLAVRPGHDAGTALAKLRDDADVQFAAAIAGGPP
jgi:predicted anti-sigma-YlaC factor YlaD